MANPADGARLLGFTPDGRRRYACDYDLPPIAGGADPSSDDQVDTGSDDGWQVEGTGLMEIDTYMWDVVSAIFPNSREWGATRFHNGAFPAQGDTVDVAYVEIHVYGEFMDDINCDLHAQDAASPATLVEVNFNITNRPRTAASIPWVQDGLGVGWHQSASLVSVIQEIVTDYAVTAIVIIFKPKTDATKYCSVDAYEREPVGTLSAKLHLEWTTAGIGEDEMMAAIGQQTGSGGDSGGIQAHHRQPPEIVAY